MCPKEVDGMLGVSIACEVLGKRDGLDLEVYTFVTSKDNRKTIQTNQLLVRSYVCYKFKVVGCHRCTIIGWHGT